MRWLYLEYRCVQQQLLSSCSQHNKSYVYPLKQTILLVTLLLLNLCGFLASQELESLKRKDGGFLLILVSVVKFNRFCYLICPCTFSAIVRKILAR